MEFRDFTHEKSVFDNKNPWMDDAFQEEETSKQHWHFSSYLFVFRILGSVGSNKIGLIVIDPVCLVICSMRDKHDV